MSLQIELDRLKANPTGAWTKGPQISSEDIRRGRGNVEHITSAEFFGIGKQTGKTDPQHHAQAAAQPQVSPMMMFGKHRGKTFAEVRAGDPGYWRWAISEVAGFEAKARKAGLLDD